MKKAPTVLTFRGPRDGAFAGGSWTFRAGEQWVVTGPNGSGKTYLASLLAGEAPLLGGRLEFGEGIDGAVALVTFGQQQAQAAHGWLQARWHHADEDPEAQPVSAFLSYEAVNEINPFEVRGPEAAARRAFARRRREVLEMLDARALRGRAMACLSNGEMRKVLLARALLRAPRLLVLDDPFAGLDAAMRLRLQAGLDRLAASGLPMVLMVRHSDEIPSCATRLLTLRGLRIAGKRRLKARAPAVESSAPGPVAAPWPPPAPSAREPVIELRGVTVRYGRRTVLESLDWTVRAGERWLVTGPNGSGKTTLLSLVTGDNPAAYANDVRVFGRAREPGESLWLVRARIGQVSPEIQCYFDPAATCLDAVVSGRVGADGRTARATRGVRKAARGWLALLGLEGAEGAAFGELSAGQQRLVLLARAMLPQPDLLLLDEPCLNLDAASRRQVLRVLEQLLRMRRDEAVVCVAHRRDDVPRGFGRVLDLGQRGRVGG